MTAPPEPGGDYCEQCGALMEPDGMIEQCGYCEGIVCVECCGAHDFPADEDDSDPFEGEPRWL